MILRIRGDIELSVEWADYRTPAIAEIIEINGQWYRVVQGLWAIRTDPQGSLAGWDAGIVVRKMPPPDKSDWVKANE